MHTIINIVRTIIIVALLASLAAYTNIPIADLVTAFGAVWGLWLVSPTAPSSSPQTQLEPPPTANASTTRPQEPEHHRKIAAVSRATSRGSSPAARSEKKQRANHGVSGLRAPERFRKTTAILPLLPPRNHREEKRSE